MLSIENARPTNKQIMSHLEEFERFCLGETRLQPAKFREINEELSIGAVLMLGKRRYQNHEDGQRHLIWRGLDNQEHDMGQISDAHVMRDYPGFNAKRSRSLGVDMISESKIITAPNGKGHVSVVTMEDGSTGIGLDYRMALRNAALKMHLKKTFNTFSLASLWNSLWGQA